jgi:hypothetical protein
MNIILAYQTPYETVAYITDDLLIVDYLPYSEFIKFIKPFVKKNYEEFIENLNRFYNVLVNTNDGSWEVYHKKFTIPTMQDLVKLNDNKQKKRFWNRDRKTKIDNIKNFTNDIVDNKYNKQDLLQMHFYKDLPKRNLSKLKILE